MPLNDLENDVPEPTNILSLNTLTVPTPLLPMKPVKVVDAQSAKRLFGRLILEFQKGTVKSREAKDLAYLLVSFLQACTQSEIEDRLKRLEQRRNP